MKQLNDNDKNKRQNNNKLKNDKKRMHIYIYIYKILIVNYVMHLILTFYVWPNSLDDELPSLMSTKTSVL